MLVEKITQTLYFIPLKNISQFYKKINFWLYVYKISDYMYIKSVLILFLNLSKCLTGPFTNELDKIFDMFI